MKGEAWLPAVLGNSIISAVRKSLRLIRAIRGVLLALINNQRPSYMPSVSESCVWCESSHGTNPKEVFNIGLVFSS